MPPPVPFKISILIKPIEFKYPLFDCFRNMDGNKKITANPIANVPIVKYIFTFFSIELVNDRIRNIPSTKARYEPLERVK